MSEQRPRKKLEPLPLDEDDGPPPPRSPRRKPHAGDGWGVLKWLAFVAGSGFALWASSVPAVQAANLAGLACFCAIASRLAQAEQHRYPR